jgi:hypothetical protein
LTAEDFEREIFKQLLDAVEEFRVFARMDGSDGIYESEEKRSKAARLD